MISIFCTLIVNKRRTIDQVPENIRDAVEAQLKKDGYDINGNLLKEDN